MEEENIYEDLESLKNIVKIQLEKVGLGRLVRDMIQQITTSKGIDASAIGALDPNEILDEIHASGLMAKLVRNLKSSPLGIMSQQENDLKDEFNRLQFPSSSSSLSSSPNSADVKNNSRLKAKTSVHEEVQDEDDDDKGQIVRKSIVKHFDSKQQVSKSNYVINPGPAIPALSPDESPIIEKFIRNDTSIINGGDVKYYLQLNLVGGKQFLESIYDDDSDEINKNNINSNSSSSYFILYIHYKSQRYCTKPTFCKANPRFNDSFMIELGTFEGSEKIGFKILESSPCLKFILVRQQHGILLHKANLISICNYDWRHILCSIPNYNNPAAQTYQVEFKGIGPEHNILIGSLDIQLAILPSCQTAISGYTLSNQISLEKNKQDEVERLYLTYTKSWLQEYLDINPRLAQRFVKLFMYDENMISRPVQTFLSTKLVGVDRYLLTPSQAAWFVALIPTIPCYNGTNGLSKGIDNSLRSKLAEFSETNVESIYKEFGANSTHWKSIESTLASRCGTLEDHAILLTCILNEFGLQPCIVLGTKYGNIPWTWVVTFDSKKIPTFWESTNGGSRKHFPAIKGELGYEKLERIQLNAKSHKFKTIDCIFNKCFLFANIQPSNLIEDIDWTVTNPSKWKQIPVPAISSLLKLKCMTDPVSSLHLKPPCQNSVLIAKELEVGFKALIDNSRQGHGLLNTKWDNKLAILLGQELSKYEFESSTNHQYEAAAENNVPSYLESMLMNYLPPGYDFNAIPFHFSCPSNLNSMYLQCLSHPQIDEVVFRSGADVSLAVRVNVFLYPEDVSSIHVMFACKYLEIS